MPRKLWGEFTDDTKRTEVEKIIPVSIKRAKLEEIHTTPSEWDKNVIVKVKNPLITQTIEVMKQTEMLQSLIDTYSNKSDSSNYLLNPCQMIPDVDFPPENVADFAVNEKFAKPIWFIPPQKTKFTCGEPRQYPQISPEVCRASFRKAVCGQLRVAGFTDTAESALVLFADAIEEFVRNFMKHIRDVHTNNPQMETQSEIQLQTLEKAYFSATSSSLTQVHNYFKHNVLARNRSEIKEFKGVLQEYDKLMKESQNMQKSEFQQSDMLDVLEVPQTNSTATVASAAAAPTAATSNVTATTTAVAGAAPIASSSNIVAGGSNSTGLSGGGGGGVGPSATAVFSSTTMQEPLSRPAPMLSAFDSQPQMNLQPTGSFHVKTEGDANTRLPPAGDNIGNTYSLDAVMQSLDK